jgi:hypothetical protein
MVDPLSFVASILAVIGAAETALQSSIEFSRFITDFKDAPAEVERLRICLQENTLLLETSKDYLEELEGCVSSSLTSSGIARLNKALAHFSSAIKALARSRLSRLFG